LQISDCRLILVVNVFAASNLKSKIFNLKYPYILVSGSGSALPGT